jgi:hypothetical protein
LLGLWIRSSDIKARANYFSHTHFLAFNMQTKTRTHFTDAHKINYVIVHAKFFIVNNTGISNIKPTQF